MTPARADAPLINAYRNAGGWGVACGLPVGPFSSAWQMAGWPAGAINSALFGAPDDRPRNDNHPHP